MYVVLIMAQRGPSHINLDGPRALAKTSTMSDVRLIELKKKLQVNTWFWWKEEACHKT